MADEDEEDHRDGIDKVFDSIADAFNKITQGPKDGAAAPAGITAFFRAVKRDDAGAVKKFIDAGINLNIEGPGGDTALHLAARNNCAKAAKLLLEAGANPRAPHAHDAQRTPLADAINFGKADVAELLTRYGGYSPGEVAPNGFTLLHRACEKGNPKLVEAMVTAGADGNEKTGNGATPLIVAIVQRKDEVADRLLDFPAVAHGINEFFVLTDPKKRTAFQLAVEKGQAAVVGKMLKFGSNVNAPDADGLTPLHHAVVKGNLSLVTTLIQHGADLNKPDNGPSPLYLACQAPEISDGKLRAQIVDCLLRHGADPDRACAATKMTPLHAAALAANGREAVAALLKYSLDTEKADNDGAQPVFCMLHRSDTDMLKALLAAGANPNARHLDDARTPLIAAVQENAEGAVALLLHHGANPKLYDAQGRSALSYAKEKKLGGIIALLEDALNKRDAPRKPAPGGEWTL